MVARRIRCPECTVILDIPNGFQSTKVRCSVCKAGFRIPGISDAEILDWIGPEKRGDTVHGAPAMTGAADGRGAKAGDQTPPVRSHRGYPAGAEGFYLDRVDQHGALFQFSAAMLEDKAFRGAIPRKCLRCGTTDHIFPRLVIFSPLLKDCTTMEAEYLDRSTKLTEDEARNLPIEEILDRLPGPDRLPSPANLPMVYWMCDMCSPAKMLLAQNEIDSKTGEGYCRMQIYRIWRAEEFLLAVGGKGSKAHDEILGAMEKHPETPWERLSGVVQQRLRQWYAPHRGERFVAYSPDRSRTRTEDGMAGLVVSSRRLIYHTSLRHRESEKGEPLELSFTMETGRQMLQIVAPNWEIKNMIVDKAGLESLRRALTEQKFTNVWR